MSISFSQVLDQAFNAICNCSYALSLSAPSPSSCAAAAVVAPEQQGAVSHACKDPTKSDHETWWCGNVGNAAAHGCGSLRGPDS